MVYREKQFIYMVLLMLIDSEGKKSTRPKSEQRRGTKIVSIYSAEFP